MKLHCLDVLAVLDMYAWTALATQTSFKLLIILNHSAYWGTTGGSSAGNEWSTAVHVCMFSSAHTNYSYSAALTAFTAGERAVGDVWIALAAEKCHSGSCSHACLTTQQW